ncbi:hypothetical protein [Streptomyces sp. SM8]|uniref:hypothetical protein n=1 Tax=Streptomyces sp. SM8 TaxID=1195457 RepID=UPI000283114C|nr:hypothetical protein [Streptomyces sp. SM8]
MIPTAPAKPDMLLDHRGTAKTSRESALDYEQARLGVAFHEAGHAVVAMSYGMNITTSEVMAWFPEPGQYAVTGATVVNYHATPAWHFAAQCAAGEVAQVQYLMVYGLWTPERALACSAEHDREQAIDVVTECGGQLARHHVPLGGKSWGQVRGMARRRVGFLWREIRTAAHAMNERTVLTGDEIAALTGLTNPRFGGAS